MGVFFEAWLVARGHLWLTVVLYGRSQGALVPDVLFRGMPSLRFCDETEGFGA